ncbi:MAG: prepilin-type N-terminal cleavage/methylation domain-containing protein [bacterium]
MAGRMKKAFTLIEVLISLLILGWSMLTTIDMVDSRLRSFYRARTRAIVVKLAQARADQLMGITTRQVDVPWTPFTISGYERYEYSLEARTLPLRSGATAPYSNYIAQAPPSDNFDSLQWIMVNVRGPLREDGSLDGFRTVVTQLPIIVVVKHI